VRNFERLLLGAVLAAGFNKSAQAAWLEGKSRHFIIYGDMAPAEMQALGARLERFDQAVRKVRGMDDPPLTDPQRLTIFSLKNEEAISRAAGWSDILGFYKTGAQGSYAFVPRQPGYLAKRSQMSGEIIFFHEYAHHLQLGSAAAALPAWVTEGFAEFFATAEIADNGNVRIGAPPLYREWSVQKADALTLDEMLGGTLRHISDRGVGMLYGRGWLLTHMLTFEPSRRGQLTKYLQLIQQGVPPIDAAKTAFGEDLRRLDTDLAQYLRRPSFSTLTVDGSKLNTGTMSLRSLRPGEAAAMDVHMSIRGYADDKRDRKLAADARRVAVAHPTDAFVQTTLAEAELAAKNFAAAEAAGRRAAAADPRSARAQLVVGKAMLEQGRKSPATADWKEIRRWFMAANRLEPENAEPLMQFYRTYPMSNVAPTKNAVDGLLYALTLAPRDSDLRIDAVHQLTKDNRLAEAREQFAPLAYYPHFQPKLRAKIAGIADALANGNRNAALQLLKAEQDKRWSGEEEDE
jgi:hypothetical protein